MISSELRVSILFPIVLRFLLLFCMLEAFRTSLFSNKDLRLYFIHTLLSYCNHLSFSCIKMFLSYKFLKP